MLVYFVDIIISYFIIPMVSPTFADTEVKLGLFTVTKRMYSELE